MKLLSFDELNKLQYDNLVNLKTNYHKIVSFDLDLVKELKNDIEKSTNQILEILKTQQMCEGSIKGYSVGINKSSIKAKSTGTQVSSSVGFADGYNTAWCSSNTALQSNSSGVINTNTETYYNLPISTRQRCGLAINMVDKIEYSWGVDCDGNVITFVSLMDSVNHIYESIIVEGSSYFDVLVSLENNYINNLTMDENSLYMLESLNTPLEDIQKIIDIKLDEKILSQRKTELYSLKVKLDEKTQKLNKLTPVYSSNYKEIITKLGEDTNLSNSDIKSHIKNEQLLNNISAKLRYKCAFYLFMMCLSFMGIAVAFSINIISLLIRWISILVSILFMSLSIVTFVRSLNLDDSIEHFVKDTDTIFDLESDIRRLNSQIDDLIKLIEDSERGRK